MRSRGRIRNIGADNFQRGGRRTISPRSTRATRNAALFYNLGNASFRAGDFGRAILNYERALLLKPQHPEARGQFASRAGQARALELRPSVVGAVLRSRHAASVFASRWR